MTSTRVVRRIRAPREKVYRTLVDGDAVARWLHPDGMSCGVHALPRVGGRLRVSLTYEAPAPSGSGKTTAPYGPPQPWPKRASVRSMSASVMSARQNHQ